VSRALSTNPVEKDGRRDPRFVPTSPKSLHIHRNVTNNDVLVDAAALAAHLSVDRGWVYEHADELGAVRLGSGPKARLRFDLEDVRRRLSATACSVGRESGSEQAAPPAGSRSRRRKAMGTSVELLPIRGRIEAA
jgi:hypothetical protein